MSNKYNKNLLHELVFTDTYKKYMNEHVAIREAMCLKVQFPAILGRVRPGDMFVGRLCYAAVGLSAQDGGFIFYCDEQRVLGELSRPEIDIEYKRQLEEMLEFWKRENTFLKLRASYPPQVASVIPSDDWTGEPGVAFPLYRMAGGYLDFGKLLRLGIPGMIDEVKRYRDKALDAKGDVKLYDAMLISLDLLIEACRYYSLQAAVLSGEQKDEAVRDGLIELAGVLDSIILKKPETLREAIQLVWIYTMLSEAKNYGRMDDYLGDFYVNDIDSGLISEDAALELIVSLWRLMAERKTIFEGRVVIGGEGRRNAGNADRFALAAMESTRIVKEIEPQLTLRLYEGIDPRLLEKALELLGEGRTYPMLYNDDVNIAAVSKAFGVNQEEAAEYVPFGCGEYVLNHRSFGSPNGVINLLKALEVTLHNGMDPVGCRKMGLSTGTLSDFNTFDEFLCAYKKQVEYFIGVLAEQEALEYKVVGENAAFLFLSMLYDDCIERGKAIFSGGLRYLGGTIETYGNTNTADSLTAIKSFVYDKKLMSQQELLDMLDADFRGYEREQRILADCPKYGNDDDEADSMAIEVHNHVCNFVRSQGERVGLHSYLVVVINNHANTILGRWTAASADGRKCGEPMANANGASGGSDKKGITALLNSIVKLDPSIHAGSVQNLKFSKDMFTKNRGIIISLLQAYFRNGGTQAMITVVNKDDLERAMAEPEKYRNVFVRVGGFSSRFVELDRDVQLEVLRRTLY